VQQLDTHRAITGCFFEAGLSCRVDHTRTQLQDCHKPAAHGIFKKKVQQKIGIRPGDTFEFVYISVDIFISKESISNKATELANWSYHAHHCRNMGIVPLAVLLKAPLDSANEVIHSQLGMLELSEDPETGQLSEDGAKPFAFPRRCEKAAYNANCQLPFSDEPDIPEDAFLENSYSGADPSGLAWGAPGTEPWSPENVKRRLCHPSDSNDPIVPATPQPQAVHRHMSAAASQHAAAGKRQRTAEEQPRHLEEPRGEPPAKVPKPKQTKAGRGSRQFKAGRGSRQTKPCRRSQKSKTTSQTRSDEFIPRGNAPQPSVAETLCEGKPGPSEVAIDSQGAWGGGFVPGQLTDSQLTETGCGIPVNASYNIPLDCEC